MSSYSTKPLLVNSLPSVKNLSVEFVYSYYEKSEVRKEGKPIDGLSPNERPARHNVISWTNPWESVSPESLSLYEELRKDRFVFNSDLDVFVGDYSSIQRADTGVSSRLSETIDRICSVNGIEGTTTDKALVLSQIVSGSVPMTDKDFNFLQKYTDNDPGFIAVATGNGLQSKSITKATGIACSLTLNNRVSSDLIRRSFTRKSFVTSLTNDIVADMLDKFQTRARNVPAIASDQDYSPTLVPTRYTEDFTLSDSNPIPVALQIRRSTVTSNGEILDEVIDTVPPDRNSYRDSKIRYGTRYSYKVSTIWCAQFIGSIETQDIVQSKCFMMDEKGDTQSVTTEENVPPPPPSDILYYFDHARNKLMIRWSTPVNKQSDVTRIQLFRRKTIYEPFTLLREFDFDQSDVPLSRGDIPNPSNVVRSNQFIGLTEDPDFGKSSDYIYAMGCTDSHGLVSNYSSQVQVKFDRTKNSLNQSLISYAGAPRQYPNFYLTTGGFTQDVIMANMSGLELYFDPEYVKVVNSDGKPVFEVGFDPDSRYVITLLDTTRAQQNNVSVVVQDLRSSSSLS